MPADKLNYKNYKRLKTTIMAKEAEEKTVDVNAAKLKALQATIDKIEKDYGKGTIMKLGDQPDWDVQVIPSGSVALDHALEHNLTLEEEQCQRSHQLSLAGLQSWHFLSFLTAGSVTYM